MIKKATCPNCWHEFNISETLFVASHEQLIGDLVAGPEERIRFLPSRFTSRGTAIDPYGLETATLACPLCSLTFSRAIIELLPFYMSIVGSPGSGKSYLLASAVHELRRLFPKMGYVFDDAEPLLNKTILGYEKTLFEPEDPESFVSLRKTEIAGSDLYRTVNILGQSKTFPRPFQFTITNTSSPENSRVLILYDNAGEHFMPGAEQVSTPVTSHLAKSSGILFILDILQEPIFRKKFSHLIEDRLYSGVRQSTVLSEMIMRIKKQLGLSHNDRYNKPLIIVLSKSDIWLAHLGLDSLNDLPINFKEGQVDLNCVHRTSQKIRDILCVNMPDFVSLAENFSSNVFFVPTSAIGKDPKKNNNSLDKSHSLSIRSNEIRPRWSSVPFLLAIQQEKNKNLFT